MWIYGIDENNQKKLLINENQSLERQFDINANEYEKIICIDA